MQLDSDSSVRDLWGSQAVKDGQTVWEQTPVTLGMQSGRPTVIHDIGKPQHQASNSVLNNALQFSEMNTPYGLVQAQLGWFVVASTTPEESRYAVEELSGEFEDRFFQLSFSRMLPEEEGEELQKRHPDVAKELITRLVKAANELRDTEEGRGELERTVAFQDLSATLARFKSQPELTIFELFLSAYGVEPTGDYVDTIKGVFEKYDLIEERFRDYTPPPSIEDIVAQEDPREQLELIARLVRSFRGKDGAMRSHVELDADLDPDKESELDATSSTNYRLTVRRGIGPVKLLKFICNSSEFFSDDEQQTAQKLFDILSKPPIELDPNAGYLDSALKSAIDSIHTEDAYYINSALQGVQSFLESAGLPETQEARENLYALIRWIESFELTPDDVKPVVEGLLKVLEALSSADAGKPEASGPSSATSLLGLALDGDHALMPFPTKIMSKNEISDLYLLLQMQDKELDRILPFVERVYYGDFMHSYASIDIDGNKPVLWFDELLKEQPPDVSQDAWSYLLMHLYVHEAVQYLIRKSETRSADLTEEVALFAEVDARFYRRHGKEHEEDLLELAKALDEKEPNRLNRLLPSVEQLIRYSQEENADDTWKRFADELKKSPKFKGQELDIERFYNLREIIKLHLFDWPESFVAFIEGLHVQDKDTKVPISVLKDERSYKGMIGITRSMDSDGALKGATLQIDKRSDPLLILERIISRFTLDPHDSDLVELLRRKLRVRADYSSEDNREKGSYNEEHVKVEKFKANLMSEAIKILETIPWEQFGGDDGWFLKVEEKEGLFMNDIGISQPEQLEHPFAIKAYIIIPKGLDNPVGLLQEFKVYLDVLIKMGRKDLSPLKEYIELCMEDFEELQAGGDRAVARLTLLDAIEFLVSQTFYSRSDKPFNIKINRLSDERARFFGDQDGFHMELNIKGWSVVDALGLFRELLFAPVTFREVEDFGPDEKKRLGKVIVQFRERLIQNKVKDQLMDMADEAVAFLEGLQKDLSPTGKGFSVFVQRSYSTPIQSMVIDVDRYDFGPDTRSNIANFMITIPKRFNNPLELLTTFRERLQEAIDSGELTGGEDALRLLDERIRTFRSLISDIKVNGFLEAMQLLPSSWKEVEFNPDSIWEEDPEQVIKRIEIDKDSGLYVGIPINTDQWDIGYYYLEEDRTVSSDALLRIYNNALEMFNRPLAAPFPVLPGVDIEEDPVRGLEWDGANRILKVKFDAQLFKNLQNRDEPTEIDGSEIAGIDFDFKIIIVPEQAHHATSLLGLALDGDPKLKPFPIKPMGLDEITNIYILLRIIDKELDMILPTIKRGYYGDFMHSYAAIDIDKDEPVLWFDELLKEKPSSVSQDAWDYLSMHLYAHEAVQYLIRKSETRSADLTEELALFTEVDARFYRRHGREHKEDLLELAKALDEKEPDRLNRLLPSIERLIKYSEEEDADDTWESLAQELMELPQFKGQSLDIERFHEIRSRIQVHLFMWYEVLRPFVESLSVTDNEGNIFPLGFMINEAKKEVHIGIDEEKVPPEKMPSVRPVFKFDSKDTSPTGILESINRYLPLTEDARRRFEAVSEAHGVKFKAPTTWQEALDLGAEEDQRLYMSANLMREAIEFLEGRKWSRVRVGLQIGYTPFEVSVTPERASSEKP
ncbi:hypothetical protein ACFL28_05100, partial [Candidatus Omnitrophota bacterium]